MMRSLPIRAQLTIGYALSLGVLMLVFGWRVDDLLRQRLLDRTDFELDEELTELALEVELADDLADLRRQLAARFRVHNSFEFQVSTESEPRFFVSDGLREISLDIPSGATPDPLFESSDLPELGQSRIASQETERFGERFILQAILPQGRYLAELRDLHWLLASASPLVMLVAVAGGYWLAGFALRPMGRLTSRVNEITASRLNQRVPVEHPDDEIGRLAETLNTMLSRLQASFEEQQRFTADAAHEFRTPLAVMRSTAELALREHHIPPSLQETLHVILEEIARLTHISEQLLALAREDAGLEDVWHELFEVGPLVRQLASDIEPLTEECQLSLSCQLEEDLWMRGDPQRFRRAVLNVLDNALKFTPAGGRIAIVGKRAEQRIQLIISDTGPGIPPAQLSHVFDRFYRVDRARHRETGGAGLGLAICQAIIGRHGGHIRALSEPGRGTQFEISLPGHRIGKRSSRDAS